MKGLIDWALARLSENSTWRGIILMLTSGGVVLDEKHATSIISVGLALVGLINVFRKVPATPDTPKPQ
jgi:hypothetical protein